MVYIIIHYILRNTNCIIWLKSTKNKTFRLLTVKNKTLMLPQQHSLWSGGHIIYVLHVPTPSEYPVATTTQNYYYSPY